MQLIIYLAGYAASQKLHALLLSGVLRVPMSFFDTTPIGRIINRFAKDVESVDSALPSSFSSSFGTLTSILITLIILINGSWLAIFALIPLAIFFAFIQVLNERERSGFSFERECCFLACVCGIVETTSTTGFDDTKSSLFEFWRNHSRA